MLLGDNGLRGPHVSDVTFDQKFTVFIVSNDADVLKAIERLVRAAGHTTQSFSSALEFLTKYECNITGCLVLDLQMPKIDGHKFQIHLAQRRH